MNFKRMAAAQEAINKALTDAATGLTADEFQLVVSTLRLAGKAPERVHDLSSLRPTAAALRWLSDGAAKSVSDFPGGVTKSVRYALAELKKRGRVKSAGYGRYQLAPGAK